MRYSYLSHLECSRCGKSYPHTGVQAFCKDCTATLLPRYDLAAVRAYIDRAEISRRPRGMWRWHELLPVIHERNRVSLGEGDAPLLSLPRVGSELGLTQLLLKDESNNPTGSFKARGLAAAISKAKELDMDKVIIPTAGNAVGALAAYASRAGLKAYIYMPKDTPYANIGESRIVGAEVELVDGLISDATLQPL